MDHRTGGAEPARHPRRAAGAAALAALLLVAAACGSSGSSSANAHPSGTASSAAASSPAKGAPCGTATTSGSATLRLSVDGHQRTVIVHVPTRAAGASPDSLVVDLHGSGSDAAEQESLSGMDATADHDGFVVAYPQGLLSQGSGFDWNIPGVPLFGGAAVPAGSADDVAFLTALPSQLAARYCVDLHRVYATGLSGGGRMSSELACDASGTFAAVAPVAGLRLPNPCPATRPVPVIAFHGTADPIDPYNGNGQAYWTYSVPDAAQRWATQDHCSAAPQPSSGSGFTLTTYSGCSGGAAVELYSLTGEGHEWPGGPTLPRQVTKALGPQSNAVDANATMWTFFSRFSTP